MSDNDKTASTNQPSDIEPKPLTAAAKRALAEAAERRAANDAQTQEAAKEINGREGPEPVRYGDWEKNGLISDF
ncbi:MAG: succinate dehydrogenase assembly factor 4 [Pseudomonadota bacterium]